MYGELGNNSTESSAVPVQVTGGLNFRSISAGLMHSCGLTTDRRVWCWGSNQYAWLGVGSEAWQVRQPAAVKGAASFEAFVVGYQHSCALASDGNVLCGGSNEFGQIGDGSAINRASPARVAGTRRFKQLSASATGSHTCALDTDGAAYCWGRNADGQLGNGGTKDSLQPVAVAGGLKFVSISPGRFHSCGAARSGAGAPVALTA